jgi:hypothetical protein
MRRIRDPVRFRAPNTTPWEKYAAGSTRGHFADGDQASVGLPPTTSADRVSGLGARSTPFADRPSRLADLTCEHQLEGITNACSATGTLLLAEATLTEVWRDEEDRHRRPIDSTFEG